MDEAEGTIYCPSSPTPPSISPNDKHHFKNPSHTSKAFEALNELRKKKLLCDVSISAGEVTLEAHKVVLVACSAYFRAMFTNAMSETTAHKVNVGLIDGQALSNLLSYMYTAELIITEDNVQTLLPASSILQMAEVKVACCEFLQSQLHPSNCIGFKKFAELHSCTELAYYTQLYIQQHFVEISAHEEFLSLELQQLIDLISDDKLVIQSEEQVYQAALCWIHHHEATRHHLIPQVVEHVRMPLLSQDFLLSRIEDDSLIKNSCKDLLIEALRYHLLRPDQKVSFQSPRTKPRTPCGVPKMLLVIGGQAPKAIKSVECYDFKEARWFQVAEMPSKRCRCGVTVLGGLVYTLGGFNGSVRVRTVEVYEAFKDQWTVSVAMEARRSTLGAAVMNGLIYAVGGFDGSSGLNSAECFDPGYKEWRSIAPMSLRRSSVGVGVVDGLLYAVGGYDGANRHCLSSVECYCAERNAWTSVCDMTCRRSGAGIGVLKGLLYAVGGHDGPFVRKSVEFYNPTSSIWTLTSNMNMCRRNAGVITYNDLLYVVGGDDGLTSLSSVEFYCPKTDAWTLLDSGMNVGRSYAGVCVIDRPL